MFYKPLYEKASNLSVMLIRFQLIFVIHIFIITSSFSQELGLEIGDSHSVLFGDSIWGGGNKLVWLPAKSAFRAGVIVDVQWDQDSIGDNSTSFGANNIALGEHSVTWGLSNRVSDRGSTVWGYNNRVSGEYSSVWGLGNISKGNYSTIWGQGNKADSTLAFYSTMWGEDNTNMAPGTTVWGTENTSHPKAALSTIWGTSNNVQGPYSTVWGKSNYTNPSKEFATVWGQECGVSGDRGTAWGKYCNVGAADGTAFGIDNFTEGIAGVTMGEGNFSLGYASLTIGQYNKLILEEGMIQRPAIDMDYPLFIIGNGDANLAGEDYIRSNALLVSRSGRTLIGDGEMPASDLHIKTSGYHMPDSISTGGIILEEPGEAINTWQLNIAQDGGLIFSRNDVEKAKLDGNGVLYVTSIVESAGMNVKSPTAIMGKNKFSESKVSQILNRMEELEKQVVLLQHEAATLRNEE